MPKMKMLIFASIYNIIYWHISVLFSTPPGFFMLYLPKTTTAYVFGTGLEGIFLIFQIFLFLSFFCISAKFWWLPTPIPSALAYHGFIWPQLFDSLQFSDDIYISHRFVCVEQFSLFSQKINDFSTFYVL